MSDLRALVAFMLLVGCAPEPQPQAHDITNEVAHEMGMDPNAPPFAMQTAETCAVNDIWCMGADGYPAPYDYDATGFSPFLASVGAENPRYDPTEQCGWNEDAQGRFAPVTEQSHLVTGRCCDSPRAFRERMHIPLTPCP